MCKQTEGFKSIFVFDPTSYRLAPKSNLTRKRWYPTTVTLPNGDIYVPGRSATTVQEQDVDGKRNCDTPGLATYTSNNRQCSALSG